MNWMMTLPGALSVGAALGVWIGFLIHRVWMLSRRKNLMLALRGDAINWLRNIERDHERFIRDLRDAVEGLASAGGKVADVQRALTDSSLLGIIEQIDARSSQAASAKPGITTSRAPASEAVQSLDDASMVGAIAPAT